MNRCSEYYTDIVLRLSNNALLFST